MNSRLNMNIREKYGFTYHIESAYFLSRLGLFNIILQPKKVSRKSVKLIEAELKKLRNDKIPGAQLSLF
ncbi:MAG: insulinase family protein [Bacteroidetes bacterium]|nr:insulinase family protein [Bacteroidota bacterium]